MSALAFAGAVAAAYAVGAIPTGLLVGKAKGVDLREHGSRNIGFTNAWRVLGAGPGLLVLVVDVGKAYAITWALMHWPEARLFDHAPVVFALSTLLGNMFNVFLRGGGGKGIGAGLGVYLALAPKAMLSGVAVFLLLVIPTRYISLSSLAAATVLAIGTWLWYGSVVAGVTTAIVAVIYWKHRGNIKRLLAGTERKFGRAGSEGTTNAPP